MDDYTFANWLNPSPDDIPTVRLIRICGNAPGSIISHDVFECERNSSRNEPVADYSLAPLKVWNATNMLFNNI